jgi:hypothetical protein
LTGGAGNDTLTGGAGADRFAVDAGTDIITDWGTLSATDTLVITSGATASYTVPTAGGDVTFGGTTTVTSNSGTLIVDASSSKAVTVTGTSGVDKITGSEFADSITGGVGADSIYGGSGADTFVYAAQAELAADATLVGGDGTDILTINPTGGALTLINTNFANVSGVETLIIGANATSGGVTIAANGITAGFTKIDASASAITAIDLTSNTTAVTVLTGTAASTVTLGNGASLVTGKDSVNDTVAVGGLTATGTLALGTGTDVITTTTGASIAGVNAGAATTAETLTFAGTTTLTAAQIDAFTTLTGSSTPQLTLTTAITATMLDDAVISTTNTTIKLANVDSNAITAKNASVASGNIVKIDGTALTGTNQFTFSRGDEVDGKFSITGGAGADVIKYDTTGKLIASNAIIDTIDGGAGTDEIMLTTSGTAITIASGDSFANVTNVEKITAGVSVEILSITRTATNPGSFTIIDLSGDTDATATNVISNTGANTITTIIGSAGIDTISLGASAPATTITGGAGADTLALASGTTATVADTDGIAITITTGATLTTTTALTATTITGGTGVDTITLAGGVSNVATVKGGTGVDIINLGAAHTGGVKLWVHDNAAANFDTISNFLTTVDKFDVGLLTTGTAATPVTGNLTFDKATAAAGKVYTLFGLAAGSDASTTTAAAALSANAVWTAGTANTIAYAIIVDDNSTSLYKITDVANSVDEIVAGELTLIGTLNAVLVTGDITYVAA